MKFWRSLTVATAVIAAVGCSSQRDQAQGNFDYLSTEERGALLVPEGMTPVVQHPDFVIPQGANYQGPLGSRQSIRSPRQVMPLVPGSRIEEGSREARIWFDAIEDMNNVADWVWEELTALLEEREIPLEEVSERSRIVTGIIEQEQGTRSRGGFWAGLRRDRIQFTSTHRLTIDMQAPSHGRTASLDVNASDINWYEDGRSAEQPAYFQRELEASFLNALAMRMQRNFEQQRVAEARATRTLRHAENPRGEPAYALDVSFDAGWVMMPGVFEYLGFVVEDLSQTDGIYYVNYQPGGRPGFFSRLAFWRSEDRGMLGLPRGDDYQFEIDEVDGVFYIVIRYQGEVLDEETMDELFPVFAEAFSEHSD